VVSHTRDNPVTTILISAAVGALSATVVSALVGFIESMECLPVTTLPEGKEWSYEIKLSGLGAGYGHHHFRKNVEA
jgi:hypothetical protein